MLLNTLTLARALTLLLNDSEASGARFAIGTLFTCLDTAQHSQNLKDLLRGIAKSWSPACYALLNFAIKAQLGVYGSKKYLSMMDDIVRASGGNEFVICLNMMLKMNIASFSSDYQTAIAAIDSLSLELNNAHKKKRKSSMNRNSRHNMMSGGNAIGWRQQLAEEYLKEIAGKLESIENAYRSAARKNLTYRDSHLRNADLQARKVSYVRGLLNRRGRAVGSTGRGAKAGKPKFASMVKAVRGASKGTKNKAFANTAMVVASRAVRLGSGDSADSTGSSVTVPAEVGSRFTLGVRDIIEQNRTSVNFVGSRKGRGGKRVGMGSRVVAGAGRGRVLPYPLDLKASKFKKKRRLFYYVILIFYIT
jgi:hypothetical protein